MIKLEFPYPDMTLLPNRKAHWAALMKATRQARVDAYLLSMAQEGLKVLRKNPPLKKVEVEITWYPSSRKVADFDSLLRCCKPYWDGIVDAGIIIDDSPRIIKQMVLRMGEVSKSNPRTIITIKEIG